MEEEKKEDIKPEAYELSKEAILKELKTSEKGLTTEKVKNRLKRYGLNELKKKKRISPILIFLSQFKDLVVLILIAAVVVSILTHEIADAIAIGAILLIIAIVGFVQEYKAEKAIELLKKLQAQYVRVSRNGKEEKIESKFLVPGDIMILESGDKISADARIIEEFNLQVDESSLTGESTPVIKSIKTIPKDTPLAERVNMVFSGTIVNTGRCKAVVVKTGHETELGKIAKMVQETKEPMTPLQRRLKSLGKWITAIVLLIAAGVFIAGVLEGAELKTMFETAVSVAISAIPEGLPAVVTIALAFGVTRMARRKALVRKLKSVETLGSVTVICSDKTGTITRNEMTVTNLFVNNKDIKVTGKGYEKEGRFLFNSKEISPKNFNLLLKCGTYCNNAVWGIGDPTELALLTVGAKAHIKKQNDRVSEIPFGSRGMYMATTHKDGMTYVKGAPERIISMCDYILINGMKKKLTKKDKEELLEKNISMAKDALRVLGFAYSKDKMENLCFLGLMGMIDPPRKTVKKAIQLCNTAGIRPIMITGDHKITAVAIAEKIGLGNKALTGKELDEISDEDLKKAVKEVSIFARVTSANKVRILKALQENNEVVAMTGDGVNDAPALKSANVGVAMNIKGTDVSKDVSDIILMDDNFSTIVAAVKEGRVIYDNIKKFLKFLLAANFDEVLLILFAIFAKLPLPILPLQILWINVMTDSLPALALGVDPAASDIMKRKPRPPKESIFHNMKAFLIFATAISFFVSAFVFYTTLKSGVPLEKVRSMVVTLIIVFEFFLVFSCRSENKPIYKIGLFSNRYLMFAVLGGLLLHLIALYTPLNGILELAPLGLMEWLKIILLGSTGFLFFELKKVIFPHGFAFRKS